MTIVSYSEIVVWQSCHMQYYYKFGLGLSPMEESNSIATGVAGHKLLETFYKCLQEGMSKEDARKKIQESFPIEEVATDKNFLNAWMLVDDYIKGLELRGEAIFVEESFVVPVHDDLELSAGFTPDLALIFNQRIDIEDYKFVGRAWSHNKLSRYSQLPLYYTLLELLGYEVRRAVLRFFNTTTKQHTYKVYTPTKEEKTDLLNDFVQEAAEIQAFKELPVAEQKKTATRTFNVNTCQYCPFVFPCSLEHQGKDASKTLATQYKDNKYGYEQ